MENPFKKISVETRCFTEAELAQFTFKPEETEILIQIGLPIISEPNSLRFAKPGAASDAGGLQTLKDAWPKFEKVKAAEKCIVIASDSNGNSLFINATESGGPITFYDHDFGMMRYVNQDLATFVQALSALIAFNQRHRIGLNNSGNASSEDYQKLKDELYDMDAECVNNADSFWNELVFLGRL